MSQEESPLHAVFRRSRIFLPVIHPVSRKVALDSIQTAVDSGADGIFLINQGMSLKQVIEMVEKKIINKALAQNGFNQSKTADYLKINRRLLYTRLKDWTP